MARSFPLAGFGGCAALFRWRGYFVPHLRALIWNAFSCRIARPRGFPSGGSCHRRGRMRGRPGCPTGQEKKPIGATGSNPLFYKERLGTESPPHPPQCAHWGTFPPRGRLWTWECLFPSEKPSPPARPAGGRAVTGVGYRAAGQAEKRRTLAGSPQTRKGGSREDEPLPPWCSFLRLSSKESRAPRRSRRGKPRRRAYPAPVQKVPKRGPRRVPEAS